VAGRGECSTVNIGADRLNIPEAETPLGFSN
jgi:hypothetical protein